MIVALHSAPQGFCRTKLPHGNDELEGFVRKAASMGFRAVQIGPLADFAPIEGKRLRRLLDELGMERNVHVGGLYDAGRLAFEQEEYDAMRKQIRRGIMLCRELSSTLVSVHPPFFGPKAKPSEEATSEAKTRFAELLKDNVEFASQNGVKVALESFCYPPFIFWGLEDFNGFVKRFPPENLRFA
jgi:sugar phosphate isomerase/epimerase